MTVAWVKRAWQSSVLVLLLAAPVAGASRVPDNHHPLLKTVSGSPLTPRNRPSFNNLVRQLVASGEVAPLPAVLDAVRKVEAGEVVAIKLRHQKSHWVYHVRVLKADGRRLELHIDGKTLKIIEGK